MKMASPRSRHAVISGRAAPARTNVMSPPDASDMMVEPNGTVDAAQTLTRAVKDYVERDDRFSLERKIYGQYFQLYYQRLMLLLPRLKEAVAAKWPGSAPHIKVLDLKEGEECVIMGTLYKDMKLKPSILDDYVKEAGLGGTSEVKSTKFVSDDDSLVLEDEGARVKLVGPAANVDEFVTGVVLAAKGRVIANGEFEADEICFPAPAPQTPIAKSSAPGPGTYVAIVSGLRVGDAAASDPKLLDLMLDYLTGNLGGAAEQSAAASVARVVVAGGALPAAEVPATSLDPRQQAAAARPLRDLDVFLTTLAAAVPTCVMPGEGDPTNQALPQQPLHPCMFPEAARYAPATFSAATNPHDFATGGVEFLGTSGQNIDNLRAYTKTKTHGDASDANAAAAETLDLMEATLRWQHLAPSAPDTPRAIPTRMRPVPSRAFAARVLRGVPARVRGAGGGEGGAGGRRWWCRCRRSPRRGPSRSSTSTRSSAIRCPSPTSVRKRARGGARECERMRTRGNEVRLRMDFTSVHRRTGVRSRARRQRR